MSSAPPQTPTTSWPTYVRTVTGSANQTAIGERIGVDQTTVGRWLRGERRPTIELARAFARAYDRPTIEAVLAAGLLTGDEVQLPPPAEMLALVPPTDLAAELARRTLAAHGTAA